MTDTVDPLKDYSDLRRAGISYAQEASGAIWTDYNVHDPGVTLLEQTCFALSQIAYQADLPTRDLLTNPRGHLCTQDLALFKPRRVLGTDPVTDSDLVAWLCACPGIQSVQLTRTDEAMAGQLHATVLPSSTAENIADPEAEFRAAFAQARPLCTKLSLVTMAQPVDVQLRGRVEIGAETLPEYAVAALYLAVAQILSGTATPSGAAKRADVWVAPERLLPPVHHRGTSSLDLTRHFSHLRRLHGIHDIASLALDPLQTVEAHGAQPVYFRVRLPRHDHEMALELTLENAPVALSIPRVREEYIRLSAEAIAQAHHHIDGPDWDVMRSGRHRHFSHAHVDALLPSLYRTPFGPTAEGGNTAELFTEYRSAIEEELKNMVEAISSASSRFTANPCVPVTDPARHRLRLELLDYLIGLQGCEMPATRHTGLHHYMTTSARHRFEITWRLDYLFALPALHRARATGPGPSSPGGFLAELAILCDLDLSQDGVLCDPVAGFGLTLDARAEMTDEPQSERLMLVPAHNPFDMLVPEQDGATLLDPDELLRLSPFLRDGRLNPDLLRRLADPDAIAAAPYLGGKWLVLFDPGPFGAPRRVCVTDDKQQAFATVAQLRATWRHLNRACEAAHLVEHVLWCDAADTLRANTADLLLPGFTARTALKSYRSYVEARVRELAPAHVLVRVHWLDPADRHAIKSLMLAARNGAAQERMALLYKLDALAMGSGG